MILLLFAFILGLAWFYIKDSFKDATSKEVLIPGVQAVLLITIAILVLVDVFMFVETERIVELASAGNGTCLSYTGSDIKFVSSVSTIIGSYLSGDAGSFDFKNDGDVYTVIEDAASPGAQIEMNFTDVTTFSSFFFRGQAEGLYEVNFLDASSGDWTTIYAFGNTSGNMVENHIFLNGTPFVNTTNVTVRINQTDAGNVSHRLVMDWFTLDQQTTYDAYCSTTDDTMYVFIYHETETDMMILLLSLLPYAAMLVGTILGIQVLLLLKWYADGNKPQPKTRNRQPKDQ